MNCNLRKLLHFTRLSFFGILTILIVGSSAAAPMTETETNHLRRSIQALNQICQHAGRELEEANTSGKFSAQEAHDYQTFIAYLSGRIEKYCRTLYQAGGSEAVAGLNCPDSGMLLPALSGPAPETADEQVADLEASLINSLGDFDEILLKEQKHVYARQSRQKETADSGTGGASSLDQDDTNQASTGGNPPPNHEGENSDQEQPPAKGENTAADAAGAGGGDQVSTSSQASKRDTLSVDDDIIARQLREAAEKETDPELKKRLWEEYRKYKAGK